MKRQPDRGLPSQQSDTGIKLPEQNYTGAVLYLTPEFESCCHRVVFWRGLCAERWELLFILFGGREATRRWFRLSGINDKEVRPHAHGSKTQFDVDSMRDALANVIQKKANH